MQPIQSETGGLLWSDDNVPFSTKFDDHYYSRADGRDECRHVFIDGNDLARRWREKQNFTIAELGFGTGLNFLETWYAWRRQRRKDQRLAFVSFEINPLSAGTMLQAISNWPDLLPLAEQLVAEWSPDQANMLHLEVDDQTSLKIYFGDAQTRLADWSGRADAWYLDGFSPAKNPAMWSASLMTDVYQHTVASGTFATYTAAGWVRKNLQNAGFEVSRVPGHGRKRHMTTGVIPKEAIIDSFDR